MEQNLTRPKRRSLFVFILLLALIVLNRILIFNSANQYVDSDQPFQWQGTKDYSEGKFYEPRFYGQNYNTFLEALVAVPFYKAGLPVYKAVPLATHLLFLFPLFFSLIVIFRSGRHRQALAGASLLLCLCISFDIVTSAPRGFVTGLFFTSFFILSFLNPAHMGYLLLNGLLLCVGYSVNPNIALAGGPLMAYAFLHNYKRPIFYAIAALMLLSFVPLYYFFDAFYTEHPTYVVYELINGFSPQYFWQNIQKLDDCFAHISFFNEGQSFTVLLAMAAMLLATWFAGPKVFYSWLFFLLLFVLAFFAGKTREGTVWPFYSYSRMYIAMPFVFIWFIALLPFRSSFVVLTLLLLALGFEGKRLLVMEEKVHEICRSEHATGVRIFPLKSVLEGMAFYKNFCTRNQSNHLLISTTFWLGPYLAYGGQAVYKDFPDTEETWADRRYWVRHGNANKRFERFVMISINYNFDKKVGEHDPFHIQRLDDYGTFLITDNQLRNGEFMDIMRRIEDKTDLDTNL